LWRKKKKREDWGKKIGMTDRCLAKNEWMEKGRRKKDKKGAG